MLGGCAHGAGEWPGDKGAALVIGGKRISPLEMFPVVRKGGKP